MIASELRLNTIYKLNLPQADGVSFLSDNQTVITIVGTDGTSTLGLPFIGADYLYLDSETLLTYDDVGDNVGGNINNATYILYYITTLNASECATLAQYSEECHMGNVIKISQTDYNTIFNAYPNSATISTGATVTYDPMSIYLIGGGSAPTKKYRHNITLGVSGTYLQFSFVNSDSTNYATTTNWSRLLAAVSAAGFTSSTYTCPARGLTWVSTANSSNLIIGVYCGTSGVLSFKSIALSYNSDTTVTFNQYVNETSTGISSISGLYDTVEEL